MNFIGRITDYIVQHIFKTDFNEEEERVECSNPRYILLSLFPNEEIQEKVLKDMKHI